ncbi:unnamed protein product [Rotaria sp. Silwood1]|nr:unnamed protein product [Rotaria sp. Silwood1]
MSANRVGAINNNQTSTCIDIENNKTTWKDLIDKEAESKELLDATCHAYSTNDREIDDQTKVCPCGRLARCHSFDGSASRNILYTTFAYFGGKKAAITLNYDEEKTLDKNHSHFLLLNNGRVNGYIDDCPRSDFVMSACAEFKCQAITIIVEGGFNTLEVIKHDLMAERPVIIIHGSGRLANVLGILLENSSNEIIPEENDVNEQLESVFHEHWSKREKDKDSIIKTIRELFEPACRKYLSVFYLERDPSLTDIIFKAVDAANADEEQQKNFLKLAISWNYADRAESMPKHLEDAPELYPSLFEQALKENRPVFVDYFLRRNHNPLQTTEFLKYSESLKKMMINGNESDSDRTISQPRKKAMENETNNDDEIRVQCALKFIIEELYKPIQTHLDCWSIPKTLKELDATYAQLIGPFVNSFYFERNKRSQFLQDIESFVYRGHINDIDKISSIENSSEKSHATYTCNKSFSSQEMLRELFLWSVYVGYADIAFVLLLQLESRISAALIAAGMAQHLSLFASTLDIRHTYNEQAKNYEVYATDCINACYKHNERLACQLLLRENPLFGNVTSIGSRIIKFINTDCFNQVLNRQWFGQLPGNATESSTAKLKFLLSLISFGLIKHRLRKYRVEDIVEQTSQETAIYIWFLLVFSYMMLFDMNIEENPVHWTKVYLIITVSAMLIEDFRKLAVDYYTRMLERWHRSGIWMIPIYAMPYILFYIGIILYLRSENRSDLFTVARIILAIDLELWYLFSLRFVSAIKLLGPKLFMIRNMLRYLTAFIYIIFVCIAAYGVVSRALTMYSELEFTAKSVFSAVFYQPYWFLYSIVDQEISNLDDIISNATSSEAVAEATVTHVLLACHMLFINILILNLLIAVFNFSINEVQDKNEYIWRYQRYELIREYFEKPLFAFPPLSLFAYIGWFIKRRCNTPEMDIRWTEFENAATYDYARKFVEDNYRPKAEHETSKLEAQINTMKNTIDRLQTQVDELSRNNEQARAETNAQTNRMMMCMNWIMTAMARVRMSNIPLPTLENPTNSSA